MLTECMSSGNCWHVQWYATSSAAWLELPQILDLAQTGCHVPPASQGAFQRMLALSPKPWSLQLSHPPCLPQETPTLSSSSLRMLAQSPLAHAVSS